MTKKKSKTTIQIKTIKTYLRKLKKIRAKFFLRKNPRSPKLHLKHLARRRFARKPSQSLQSKKSALRWSKKPLKKTFVKARLKHPNKFKSLIRSLRKILRKHAIRPKRFRRSSKAQTLTAKIKTQIASSLQLKNWALKPLKFKLSALKKNRRSKTNRRLKTIKKQTSYELAVAKQWLSLSKNKKNIFLQTLRKRFKIWYTVSNAHLSQNNFAPHFQQTLNRRLKRKYFQIKKLRLKLHSKFPKFFFNKPNKWSKPLAPTKKQIWLEKAYQKSHFNIAFNRFQGNSSQKFRQDFLQTLLGKYFVFSHLSTFMLWNGQRYYSDEDLEFVPKRLRTLSDQNQMLHINHKLGWFYTNLTRTKKVRQEISLATRQNYPYNIFSIFWRDHKKTPWLDYLQSSRRVYTGLLARQRREQKWTRKYAWIPYLRKKKPKIQKRNRLYRWRQNLLFSFWTGGMIRKKKSARIKKVVTKVILPFYGNLTEKQFHSIKKKVQRKKPESLSRDDLFFGQFERRLDVVVYRLNLAPNIFWARKLIQDGAIFISSTTNTNLWEKIYAPLKKFIYPLALRDPKNLYKKTSWAPFQKTAKIPFLLEPLKKVDYLVQPGEIIQCAPGALLNQFKTNSVLWKKPIPKHFLTFSDMHDTQKNFQYRKNKISAKATQNLNHTIMATLLFPPSYQNLLKTDRVNRGFMHWITL